MGLIDLFLAFFQIGIFAFGGGYAVLPMIQQVIVEQKGWITMTEMLDVVTISQMTPGPIAINAASFVGTKLHGIPGAIIATLGNIMPQFIIMMIIAYFVFRGKKIEFLDKMLKTLRPGVIGLIAAAALSMLLNALLPDGTMDSLDPIVIIGFVLGIVLTLRKVDMIKAIGVGALVGIFIGLI